MYVVEGKLHKYLTYQESIGKVVRKSCQDLGQKEVSKLGQNSDER
jgi:hypothetical protein